LSNKIRSNKIVIFLYFFPQLSNWLILINFKKLDFDNCICCESVCINQLVICNVVDSIIYIFLPRIPLLYVR
jgi:hypothetical protein